MSDSLSPSPHLRDLLRGFPSETVRACDEFQKKREEQTFEPAFTGIIQHHLIKPMDRRVSQLPGSTSLVGDLGIDSLTMAEMAFLFEDLFGMSLPHEEFTKIVTLDDLRGLLRAKLHLPLVP